MSKTYYFLVLFILVTIHPCHLIISYSLSTEPKLRTREFRFDPDTYLKDHNLVAALKKIGNSNDELELFIKERYGTVRQPKRQRTQVPSPLAETHHLDMSSFQPMSAPKRASTPEVEIKNEAGTSGSQVSRLAEYYIKAFEKYAGEKTERQLQSMSEKERKAYLKEKAAHDKEMAGKRQETLLRALHKAAWEGQAQAATTVATRLQDFNAKLSLYGLTPLHQAVFGSVGPSRYMNVLAAERLIDHGAAVDARDKYDRTPLYHASRRGDLKMMELLLSRGADPNAAAKNGSTPLHCAAETGSLEAVLKLLSAGAVEYPKTIEMVGEQRAEGEDKGSAAISSMPSILGASPQCGTALHWAARAGQADVVKHLLEPGVDFDPLARDWNGATPLHLAANEYRDSFPSRLKSLLGFKMDPKEEEKAQKASDEKIKSYMAVIRFLMGHGADKDAVDADGRTPLHWAAARGNLKCVRLLLNSNVSKGYRPSSEDDMGHNPLMLAVVGSDPSNSEDSSAGCLPLTMEELIQKTEGGLEGKDKRGKTALHLAVLAGRKQVAKCLLVAGAAVDARDNDGATPLILASRSRQLGCVQVLLDKFADVNAVDNVGGSSLASAALAGDHALVLLLLEGGADVNLEKDSGEQNSGGEGRTPLHEAAEGGDCDVIECLLAHGAEINHASKSGRTALHEAARCSNVAAIRLLIDAGANLNAEDNKGRTALDLAEKERLDDVISVLREAGAKSSTARWSPSPPDASAEFLLQRDDSDDVDKWDARFLLLQEFVGTHKRVPARGEWYKGCHLGAWVELQQEKIRWDEIREERLQSIGSIGGELKDWGVGVPWVDWLQQVKDFIAEHGRLPASWEDRQRLMVIGKPRPENARSLALGWWCKFQQSRYLGSSLDDAKKRELEGLRQWRWDGPMDRAKRRISLDMKLYLFMHTKKRLPLPEECYMGVPLGQWCQLLRRMRVWKELSAEREQKILKCCQACEVPWSWVMKSGSNKTFEEALSELDHLVKEKKQDVMASGLNDVDPRLKMWMSTQSAKFAAGELDDARIKALEEIEQWSWDPPAPAGRAMQTWEQWLELLKAFVSEFERMPKYRETYKGLHIGWWAGAQRQQYARGKMQKERCDLLAAIPGWEERAEALASRRASGGQQAQQQQQENVADQAPQEVVEEMAGEEEQQQEGEERAEEPQPEQEVVADAAPQAAQQGELNPPQQQQQQHELVREVSVGNVDFRRPRRDYAVDKPPVPNVSEATAASSPPVSLYAFGDDPLVHSPLEECDVDSVLRESDADKRREIRSVAKEAPLTAESETTQADEADPTKGAAPERAVPAVVPTSEPNTSSRPSAVPSLSVPPPASSVQPSISPSRCTGTGTTTTALDGGAEPVTADTPGLTPDLKDIIQRACVGKLQLKSQEILRLLDGWKAAGLPVGRHPPIKPQG